MSDVKKIATRDSYGNALAELGTAHENVVVLDADLAAATKTGVFKKAHPERFIDCGIAESNMMGVAAGLAAAGKVPFASSFAMFAAGRAFEQIRNSIGYPKLNVKIGATHAGISVGEDGATHQLSLIHIYTFREALIIQRSRDSTVCSCKIIYDLVNLSSTHACANVCGNFIQNSRVESRTFFDLFDLRRSLQKLSGRYNFPSVPVQFYFFFDRHMAFFIFFAAAAPARIISFHV